MKLFSAKLLSRSLYSKCLQFSFTLWSEVVLSKGLQLEAFYSKVYNQNLYTWKLFTVKLYSGRLFTVSQCLLGITRRQIYLFFVLIEYFLARIIRVVVVVVVRAVVWKLHPESPFEHLRDHKVVARLLLLRGRRWRRFVDTSKRVTTVPVLTNVLKLFWPVLHFVAGFRTLREPCISGANVINKLLSSINVLHWNTTLWSDVPRRMTIFN